MAIQDYKPNTSPEQLPPDGLIRAVVSPEPPPSHSARDFFNLSQIPHDVREASFAAWSARNQKSYAPLVELHTHSGLLASLTVVSPNRYPTREQRLSGYDWLDNTPKPCSPSSKAYWLERIELAYPSPDARGRSGCAAARVPERGRASLDFPDTENGTCLDYCAESQTIRPAHNLWETFPTASGKEWDVKLGLIMPRAAPEPPKVANRVRVFKSGEVEVRTVLKGRLTSKPPPRSYGPRWSRGVSGNGRRAIRRSVAALVAAEPCQVALYTLSSQHMMADRDFVKSVQSFLAWGRKYLPDVFKYYVMVFELQARGTLHAHFLLFKRVPKGLWRRMRDLWAVKYEMGPGSFDVKKIRFANRAAAYLTKYLTDKKSSYRLGLDGEGMLTHEKWRVGRNGLPYERMNFRGNAYRVSYALRYYALPVAEYHLPWGSPLALRLSCNLKGGVRFFGSSSEALDWVTSNLPSGP